MFLTLKNLKPRKNSSLVKIPYGSGDEKFNSVDLPFVMPEIGRRYKG